MRQAGDDNWAEFTGCSSSATQASKGPRWLGRTHAQCCSMAVQHGVSEKLLCCIKHACPLDENMHNGLESSAST